MNLLHNIKGWRFVLILLAGLFVFGTCAYGSIVILPHRLEYIYFNGRPMSGNGGVVLLRSDDFTTGYLWTVTSGARTLPMPRDGLEWLYFGHISYDGSVVMGDGLPTGPIDPPQAWYFRQPNNLRVHRAANGSFTNFSFIGMTPDGTVGILARILDATSMQMQIYRDSIGASSSLWATAPNGNFGGVSENGNLLYGLGLPPSPTSATGRGKRLFLPGLSAEVIDGARTSR